MDGRETAYDPSRHGPMAEAPLRRGAAAVLQGPPGVIDELAHRLSESIETVREHTTRLREFCDGILGPEPEPGATKNGIPEPPSMGRGNQLLEVARALNVSQAALRYQLDRLSRI